MVCRQTRHGEFVGGYNTAPQIRQWMSPCQPSSTLIGSHEWQSGFTSRMSLGSCSLSLGGRLPRSYFMDTEMSSGPEEDRERLLKSLAVFSSILSTCPST